MLSEMFPIANSREDEEAAFAFAGCGNNIDFPAILRLLSRCKGVEELVQTPSKSLFSRISYFRFVLATWFPFVLLDFR